MKRVQRSEEVELDDGTIISMTFERGTNALVKVRAAKLGNGPDEGDTAALSIDVPGEWFERVSATVFKMSRHLSSGLEICPDHGRWHVNYQRPAELRYSCPTCKPTPGAAPEPDKTPTDDEPLPF